VRNLKNKLIIILLNFIYLCPNTYSSEIEASANEFPATTGTVLRDHDGFMIEWEDGNWTDFANQLQNAFNFEFEQIDLFGLFDSNQKNNAHEYHRSKPDNASKSTVESTESTEPTESTSETDWRTERKWWQRGASPIL